MDYSTSGFPVHHQLPELAQTHVHWVGYAIQPSHPLLSPSPPALNLSQHQGLFQWVSSSHQVPKYWSFSFSINPSNECSGLISFRMDWLDFLAAQGTLKSLQHHSWKASILWHSAFFIVQLSHHIRSYLILNPVTSWIIWFFFFFFGGVLTEEAEFINICNCQQCNSYLIHVISFNPHSNSLR